jgi:hypothetical protein
MGEGKTRVILPMLALHWADGTRIVRLNVLPTLMEEAYAHLHSCLTASVLGRKLFTLPFHRDVQPTEGSVLSIRSCLRYCQQVPVLRGLSRVTPLPPTHPPTLHTHLSNALICAGMWCAAGHATAPPVSAAQVA